MKTTKKNLLNAEEKITVNSDTLAELLDCGKATAVQIGKDSGARIQVGRRVLYSVPKVQAYLANLAADQNK